jgi:hypothetical protein
MPGVIMLNVVAPILWHKNLYFSKNLKPNFAPFKIQLKCGQKSQNLLIFQNWALRHSV